MGIVNNNITLKRTICKNNILDFPFILNLIFNCYSSQIDRAISNGNYAGAVKYSRQTKILCTIAIILGIALDIAFGVVFGGLGR